MLCCLGSTWLREWASQQRPEQERKGEAGVTGRAVAAVHGSFTVTAYGQDEGITNTAHPRSHGDVLFGRLNVLVRCMFLLNRIFRTDVLTFTS